MTIKNVSRLTQTLGLAALFAGGSLNAANAIVVYNNTTINAAAPNGLLTSAASPRNDFLEDIQLAPGTTAAGPFTLTSLVFGAVNTSATAKTGAVFFEFYAPINVGATGSQVVNPTFLGGFGVNLGSVTAGAHSYTVTLSTPFAIPVDNFGIEEVYTNTAGTTLNANLTPLFDGNGPTVGSSPNIAWNGDGSGIFTGSEGFSFSGSAPNQTNFYLSLSGNVVPEPGAVAMLMGLGVSGLAIVRRRKSARK